MRFPRVLLVGVGLTSVVVVGGPRVQAVEVQTAPSSVTCVAPVTGVVGPTGPKGWTGVTGPLPGPNGPRRSAHLVAGDVTPPCALLAGLCAYPVPGGAGAEGATGATGPEYAENGPGRVVHVRGGEVSIDVYCGGIPRACWFGVQGPQGPTGPVGDTGATASVNGPSRLVRGGGVDLYQGGERVLLDNCNLPALGGGSVSMLPFALALLGVGVVAVATGRRRRSVSAH